MSVYAQRVDDKKGIAMNALITPPTNVPVSRQTPDSAETHIGTLEFSDGVPSPATLDKVYDHLDFIHAFEAFVNGIQGVSMHALHQGLLDAGVKDNEVLLYSDLMDAKSVFLTANADTVYTAGFLDLTGGPLVFETPPQYLGAINDYWFRWVTDLGGPGPDRGLGGKYLILPPDYDGPLPEGGFFTARAQTTFVMWFGRMFLENNSPKPAVDKIRSFLKIYPYEAGSVGTSYAAFLRGEARLGSLASPPETIFHEGVGRTINTIPPNDFSFYEMLDEVVQQEPATSLDAERMGSIAAIGIVKSQPFAPDARMKRILTEAAAVGNATARSLFMSPRDPSWYYYPGSAWMPLTLTISGFDFETPPPVIEGPVHEGMRTPEGVKTLPTSGYRMLDARTNFYYGVIMVSPAEGMLVSGIGSQYLMATVDVKKEYFDGAKTYELTLPKDIPALNFWSLTLYDNQTRAMLDTPQRYPRAGSQSHPSPAAEQNPDGTTTVYFAPQQPNGVARGNWIQTLPGRGWFVLLRLYGPLEPFFDKTWRPGEIEMVG
jgi:hypothetical protein